MDDLNKNQIILLTLLVSFVTSIATGIVTVTLMDQSPQGVTNTINQVVERTIERVVPGETSTVVKEVPVIVTEEDLIVKAINTVSGAVFRLEIDKDNERQNIGSAIYVDARGYFATDLSLFSQPDVRGYYLISENGEEYKVTVVARGSKTALLGVNVEQREKFLKDNAEVKPVTLDQKEINVGQTVIGVGATTGGSHIVSVSIVSRLVGEALATSTLMTTNASSVETIGGPLVNIQGGAVGLNLGGGQAISAREVKTLIDSIN